MPSVPNSAMTLECLKGDICTILSAFPLCIFRTSVSLDCNQQWTLSVEKRKAGGKASVFLHSWEQAKWTSDNFTFRKQFTHLNCVCLYALQHWKHPFKILFHFHYASVSLCPNERWLPLQQNNISDFCEVVKCSVIFTCQLLYHHYSVFVINCLVLFSIV